MKMREKEKERDYIHLALADCNNCVLTISDESFNVDDYLGKEFLETRLAQVEQELKVLRNKFDRL